MKKLLIGLFILVLVMVVYIWKSNSDRDARQEALAIQTEQHNNEMAKLEAGKQAKLEKQTKDKINEEQARLSDEKNKENLNIALAEAAVKTQLVDPDSAKFQNQKGNCGEVNSKNKFGGYVGYSRYVFLTSDNMVAIESNSSDSIWPTSVMNELWSKHCS
ncbi:hypothetical protein F966_02206 [Acinetobacter higginsii]|uniref:Uncharacterized protein n=1 Tax=Acinetobacter higginsii TaxID=70347 RepID=N8XQ43_9GAMM|nr:hypothetical protein [Acinetobacter higginsii]ENV09548.1 hypothetical protein F966_02206 [Acinetobacter higginsii]